MKTRGFITELRGNQLLLKGITDTNLYFLANVGSKLVSFLIIPFITRLLGVQDFAVYDLFLLCSGFLSMIVGLGMDSGVAILITENREDKKKLKTLFSILILSSLLGLMIVWLMATLYDSFFVIPYLSPDIVQLIFVYTLLNQINYNTFSFIRWFGESKKAAILNLIAAISGTLLGFSLLWLYPDKGIEIFLIGLITGNGLGALISIWLTRNFFSFNNIYDKKLIKELLKLSIPFVPTYLGSYLMQIADRLIITYFFGTYALGLYALCNRIAQIPTIAVQIIAKGFQPILLSNYDSPEGIKLNRQLFSVFWLGTIPSTLILIMLAKPLVLFFGDHKYLESVAIIPFMINAAIFFGAFYLFGYSYSIKRKTQYVTIITFITVGAVFGFSILLIPFFDFVAIAIATFTSSAIGATLYIYLSEKLYSFGYKLNLMWLSIIVNSAILLLYYSVF